MKPRTRGAADHCPECGRGLGIDPGRGPAYAVCDHCAAVAIRDAAAGRYRAMVTQEWLDVVLMPGFYDLIEARQAALDRITSPSP